MKPICKLYEPPIDDGDDEEPETSKLVEDFVRSTSFDDGDALVLVKPYGRFCVYLVIGGMIAGAALVIAGQFIP